VAPLEEIHAAMIRLLDLMTALSILLMLMVLRSVRRQHTRVEYSVAWLLAALVLLVLSRMPETLSRVGAWLGFQQNSDALMFLVSIVFLGVFYRFSVIVSALKDNNIALAQRVAILEFQLRTQHEERQTKPAV
jgi:hypothetical protein